jgi:hypothetical protein
MKHLINHTIGAGQKNNPDDIRIVRGTLKALKGDEIIPEKLSGFIDDELDADIRDFQQKSGLIEDGRLTPKGETERNLISRITGEGIDRAAAGDAVLSSSVGDGGENDPADVVALKRVLGTLGFLKYDRTAPPSPFVDSKLVEAIAKLQRDANLLTDGRADSNGETIAAIGELLEEKPSSEGRDETQVAIGPALIPLFMFLARTVPHIIRQAPRIVAGNEAAKKLVEQDQKRRSQHNENSEFTGQTSNGTKLEHIPPDPSEFGGGKTEFPPPDPDKKDGKLKGRPSDPVRDDPTVFPIPGNPEDLVTILPGGDITPVAPIIIERKGDEPTRVLNAQIARLLEKLGVRYEIIHVSGSRDADGNEIPEAHLKNKDTGGLKGGNFPDITFEIRGANKIIRFHINTADVRADGVTLSSRERKAAESIQYNMEDDAVLLTLPKLRPGETLDIEALSKRLENIMRDLEDLADGKIDQKTFDTWIKSTEKLPTK